MDVDNVSWIVGLVRRLLGSHAENRSPLSRSVVVLLCEQLVNVVHGGCRPVLIVTELTRLLFAVEHIVLRLGSAARRNVSQQLSVVVSDGALAARLGTKHAGSLVLVELAEHGLDGFLVRILTRGLRLLRYNGLLGLIKLTVPDLLNLGNLLVAEKEPALHLGTLLNWSVSFFFVAVLIIKSLLSEVTKLECNLNDGAQVHAVDRLARREMEAVVGFEFGADESLHGLQIILIEGLSDQVENQNALLMGD